MNLIFTPASENKQRNTAIGVLFLLALSALALLLAPSLMPEGYSWITHTTSESAAQNLEGAWLARLGFLLFGLAVVWLATECRSSWARGAVWMHLAFGVFMLSTAAFSHQPWLDGVPFDTFEDQLHSFTATAMGFAFSLSVFVRLVQRKMQKQPGVLFDILALLSATFIPMTMMFQPDIAGVVQRLMFGISYAWYAKETWQMYLADFAKS
jgi:hypothetical protein